MARKIVFRMMENLFWINFRFVFYFIVLQMQSSHPTRTLTLVKKFALNKSVWEFGCVYLAWRLKPGTLWINDCVSLMSSWVSLNSLLKVEIECPGCKCNGISINRYDTHCGRVERAFWEGRSSYVHHNNYASAFKGNGFYKYCPAMRDHRITLRPRYI